MPALNVSLKVARIAEASGVPYVENVAKIAAGILKPLEQKGKNKKNAEDLCQSITNTMVVIDSAVRMHGEDGTSFYIDSCREMEGLLEQLAQDIQNSKLKHRSLRGIFCADDFGDVIQETCR